HLHSSSGGSVRRIPERLWISVISSVTLSLVGLNLSGMRECSWNHAGSSLLRASSRSSSSAETEQLTISCERSAVLRSGWPSSSSEGKDHSEGGAGGGVYPSLSLACFASKPSLSAFLISAATSLAGRGVGSARLSAMTVAAC